MQFLNWSHNPRPDATTSYSVLLTFSCQEKLSLIRLYHPSPRISVIVHLVAMSVIMEQQGTSTSTVTNTQIPGVPSDASVLNSLRNAFRRNDFQKRPTSTFKARTTEVRGTVDVPTHTAIVCEPKQARREMRMTING